MQRIINYRNLFQLTPTERDEILKSLRYSDEAKSVIVDLIDRVDRVSAGEDLNEIYPDGNAELLLLMDLVSQAEYLRASEAHVMRSLIQQVHRFRVIILWLSFGEMVSWLACVALVLWRLNT